MGNQPHSSKAGGKIYLQTDKPFYYGGDTVTGKIYLDLTHDYHHAKLSIKIQGEEVTSWEEKRNIVDLEKDEEQRNQPVEEGQMAPPTPYKQVEIDVEGENEFYENKAKIYEGELNKGQHEIGFQFALKQGLPATIYYDEKDVYAEVKYRLKAFLDSGESDDYDIKFKQELVIHEVIKGEDEKAKGHQVCKPSMCCCISQGESKIEVKFDKKSYLQGEVSKIKCAIDNSKCKLKIPHIYCNLTRYITLTGEEKWPKDEKEIYEKYGKKLDKNTIKKQFVDPLAEKKFDGVDALEDQSKEGHDKTFDFPLVSKKDAFLEPSVNGKFIQCNYVLTVSAPFDGTCLCCSEKPCITSKVQLQSQKPKDYGIVAQPSNWAPNNLGVKSIVFDDSTKDVKKNKDGKSKAKAGKTKKH